MRLKFKVVVILLYIILFLAIIFIYLIKKPSNSRDWEIGFQKLPRFQISDNSIKVSALRNQHYLGGQKFSLEYSDEEYLTDKITKAWIVVSKFTGFEGVAHTYFIFDFENNAPLTISVEARREKGEKYNITRGLINEYELIYVWGTEKDAIVRRVLVNQDKVYMYPLRLTKESAKKLLTQLAIRSNDLNNQPRFYNTLFSNCTNELAKTANSLKPGAIPWNTISQFLPGYAAKDLFRLGYIETNLNVDQIEKKHFINTFVEGHYQESDFSYKLRDYLTGSHV